MEPLGYATKATTRRPRPPVARSCPLLLGNDVKGSVVRLSAPPCRMLPLAAVQVKPRNGACRLAMAGSWLRGRDQDYRRPPSRRGWRPQHPRHLLTYTSVHCPSSTHHHHLQCRTRRRHQYRTGGVRWNGHEVNDVSFVLHVYAMDLWILGLCS